MKGRLPGAGNVSAGKSELLGKGQGRKRSLHLPSDVHINKCTQATGADESSSSPDESASCPITRS
jgi:hypothetical protein